MKITKCPHCANRFSVPDPPSKLVLLASVGSGLFIAGLAFGAVVALLSGSRGERIVTVEKPVEKVVTKIVEKPVDRVVTKVVHVEKPVATIGDKPPEATTQKQSKPASQGVRKSISELNAELRQLRIKEFALSISALRFGLATEQERQAGLDGCRMIRAKGLRNVDEATISRAEALSPEWVIRAKKRDGRDTEAEKIILFEEYRRFCANNSRFRDLIDDDQFFEDVLDINRPDMPPADNKQKAAAPKEAAARRDIGSDVGL